MTGQFATFRLVVLLTSSAVVAIASSGCQNAERIPSGHGGSAALACPPELQSAVRLAASSMERTLPVELAPEEGPVPSYGLKGRRLLISLLPDKTAQHLKLASSELTIRVFGGTLPGWAAVANERGRFHFGSRGNNRAGSHALEIIPGMLRITPFLAASTLRPETVAVDIAVRPGGVPIDSVALAVGRLWSPERVPLPPEQVDVSFTPIRHATVFTSVQGVIELRYSAQSSDSPGMTWECSAETRVTIVDHESIRPLLWDIRAADSRGKRTGWLALFQQRTGPIRAVFTDAESALGFANWARQTGAQHTGDYRLGLVQLEPMAEHAPLASGRRLVPESFRPITPEDLGALRIGLLDEP